MGDGRGRGGERWVGEREGGEGGFNEVGMNVFMLVPLLRTKFWKKEFVGSGVERRFGVKNLEGSGTTVDSA